jgi:nicotinate-nucleotide adenylyltransferase
MNICILGGTFDPVHTGHIMMAEVVQQKMAPAEVVFIPAGRPWLKTANHISPAVDRLAMLRLAIDGHAGFSISTIEIERQGPTYTLDTIRELRNGAQAKDELYFILGWDNLLDLPRWYKPQEIIQLCKLVAVPRVGFRIPDPPTLETILPGLSKRVILLDKPVVDISATVIRERARRGLSLNNLVPEAVEQYIKEKGLYR